MRDLVVLAADKNIEHMVRAALARPDALRIRRIEADFQTHPGRDPGARTTGVDVLRQQQSRYSHALLIFDFEGCGAEREAGAAELEATLDRKLSEVWQANGKTIIVEPEADVWVWGNDHALAEVLQWNEGVPIRTWLGQKAFVITDHGKPGRPKEALESVLQHVRVPRSSAVYKRIVERISLPHCTDPAFSRLAAALRRWFPGP